MAGQVPDGRGGPHAFADNLENPVLDEADSHHLSKALRVRKGDPCTVSDGVGNWRAARFGHTLEPVGEIISVSKPEPSLRVGFAVIKASRPELVVQKLTELGIDQIVGFFAEHSVVRWDDEKREANRARWQRISREAAMQSRQVWLPEVAPIVDFAVVPGLAGSHLAELGVEPTDEPVTSILIGPEGGWSDSERAGRPLVGLGPHVLRAETAAIAAAVQLTQARYHL